MSKKFRALLVGVFALVAFSAAASSASAFTTGNATYTATTNAVQQLQATVLGSPTTIQCLQTLVLVVLAGTYTPPALPIGYVSRATFSCAGGHTVVSSPGTLAGLPSPSWPIGLNSSTASTALLTALNVKVVVDSICTFTGAIGFSVNNGSTAGSLLGANMTNSCGGSGIVSTATYTVTPAVTWS
jgi:hypothetical protein